MASYLVTGGAGFIGSAVVMELVRRCERVRVLDNCSTGSRNNLAEVWGAIEFLDADVIDPRDLIRGMKGCDYVIHLAALASVPRSVEDPIASNQINAEGTLNILMAAHKMGVKRVVYAASSSAYGDSPELPKQEAMCPNPISPYAISKLAGEHYCLSFPRVYGLETVCLRYFNVFGPRQNPNSPYSGVLSRFIAALLNSQTPVVYGDGEQSRDFTYVEDVVQANLLACHAPDVVGMMMNIGTGKQWTLNQTLAILQEILQTGRSVSYEPARAGDVLHSVAEIRLARERLGYAPHVSFVEGLHRTVAWYRASFDLPSPSEGAGEPALADAAEAHP